VAQQGQITNRPTQAIGQLGAELSNDKPNLEVGAARLDGAQGEGALLPASWHPDWRARPRRATD
jgi:hypothetical protein